MLYKVDICLELFASSLCEGEYEVVVILLTGCQNWYFHLPEYLQRSIFRSSEMVSSFATPYTLYLRNESVPGVDGKIRMFRPHHNMKRMRRSAKRAGLPTFDCDEFARCIAKLMCVDRDWVPKSLTSSMYIRPTLISTEPSIGVLPPIKPSSMSLLALSVPISHLEDSPRSPSWPTMSI
ncbi:putative branched-chain-amino-acid aminotransferase, cytosolic [Apostichopus japonicus]|uniref:Putative branched-chain-amino-acid aminotransferase, cytosolic n=1 Tax=Stichopus japonicus TaxID=307972 RepID=A0A2G8KL91_STIJA|nr:putative branched-chain-amino-acid aminotransferase, cytosolic [Apostichopus japonicus]